MIQARNPMQVRQQLHSIRDAQKKIRDKINHIKKQLKRLETLPGTQPWRSFHRAQTVKELKSPFPTLKDALKHDLMVLKSELRNLGRKGISVRIQGADRANKDFEKELEKKLKEAEKDGSLPENELAELRSKAESVVKQYVGILNAAPSEKNIERVLDKLETPLLLGSDTESGTCGEALRAVASAAEKLVVQKEKAFRKNPTADNFDQLLQSKATAATVGGKTQGQPADWKPAQTSHKVIPGDTLSGIAKRYYENMSHWDVIYMENYGVIGDDVRQLRVGITLKIP
jgi:nucleoid-associated protein YgaU